MLRRLAGSPWTRWALLAACLLKLWILPLSSGFWVDEMVTAFVVHHGPDHPSLRVAPQVTATNYYALPALAERWFGFSEAAYRVPSLLLMGLALFVLARLAARLIHPDAGWFVVFAALTLRGINYAAADARPYALAIALALLASWFLVRWLDRNNWLYAAAFILAAGLIWRAHLIAWPFYLLFAIYAAVRLIRRDTQVTWPRASLAAIALGALLVPVLRTALDLMSEASAHVVADKPSLGALFNQLKFGLVGASAVAAWGLGGWALKKSFRSPPAHVPDAASAALLAGWWLVHPLALFAFSHLTGNSVFVTRYLSVALPGTALAAALCVSMFVPARFWKPGALAAGLVALLTTGSMGASLGEHHNSRWREASQAIRELGIDAATPVVYPSPFIEAREPVWRPGMELPAFLYCHLETYSAGGAPYLLPFEMSEDAESYAAHLAASALAPQGRFVIYGGDTNAHDWQQFFSSQPALTGWRSRRLGPFGDVDAVLFTAP